MGGCGSKDLSEKDIEAVQRIVGDGQSHVEQSLNRSIETLLAEHRKELKALEGFQKAVDSQKEQIDSQKMKSRVQYLMSVVMQQNSNLKMLMLK